MADVKVYSTPTCPWCNRLKSFLDEKGVKYEDFNVARDSRARQEMLKKSGQLGVPQIEINGRIIVGFDKEQIEEALGLR